MYKVFFKENIFLLTDNQDFIKTGTISLIHKDFNATKSFVWQLLGEEKKFTAVICHDDIEVLFSIFKSCFLYAKAAGAFVRKNSEILVLSDWVCTTFRKATLKSLRGSNNVRFVKWRKNVAFGMLTSPVRSLIHSTFTTKTRAGT